MRGSVSDGRNPGALSRVKTSSYGSHFGWERNSDRDREGATGQAEIGEGESCRGEKLCHLSCSVLDMNLYPT